LVLRSVMGIPMISRSQLMGLVYADMRIINGHFAQADVDLLTVLANQGAAALENAAWARTLEQRVADRTAELTTINSISQDLVSELDLEAVLELVGEKIREIFDVETVYLALYDPGSARVNFGYNYYQGQRFHDMSIKYGEGLVSKIIETGQPMLINENVAERYAELKEDSSPTPAKSYLSVPIIVSDSEGKAGQTVIGVISVQSTEREGLFDEADLRLLTTIAANVGVAIEKAHLFEETKQAREIAEATAQELSQTLAHLRATQSQLVESEKMAALGHLIAGIAHEINTPLGAIGASIGNIADDLGELVKRMPQMFQQILPEQQQDFFALIDRASQHRHTLTSREERQLRRSLRRELEDQDINEADFIAEILVDMGIHDDIEAYLPLLRSENVIFILQAAQNLVNPQTSSQTIQMAVDRASKVVFALKRYAHQDASGQMIEANIIDGIEDVLTLYHSHLKRGVEVTKHYDDIPQIYCQPDELNQVWTNLIHNALQAMDYRGNLGIEVRRLENGDKSLGDEQSPTLQSATANYLAVSITDSGAGIPDEIKDRIFNAFFTTKAAGEGSGLGLDIVRKIVEQHGGMIDFSSQPGRTTFRVLLPINQA